MQGYTNNTIDVCEGNNNSYTFTATVAAGYLSPVYQWQLSTDKGAAWNDLAGAADFTYRRQPSKGANYWYRFTVAEAIAAGLKLVGSSLRR